jgi:S1-C subfamily serine protease
MIISVAALGTAGIAAGVVLGGGGASGAPPGTAPGAWAYLQPADSASGGGGLGTGRDGSTPTATGATATSRQEVGIVDVDSILGYQRMEAAGTGMVLTSDGDVLTNNHVVEGATSITVTVVRSGATYTATVVGTDPSADVAVLHLEKASGLARAALSSSPATVREAVTAVGNAGGTGTLRAAAGTVTALDQSITATESDGGNAEQLTGLVETDAGIQPGDSGGPLYGAAGTIVGMDTAASSGGEVQAYAIPISTAERIAAQIEQGDASTTIHEGLPAFLGVSLSDDPTGVAVLGVLPDGPAASAGMTAGDVITAVGGQAVASAADLGTALGGYSPGQQVTVTWADAGGGVHSATVTLGTGPAL